MIIGYEKSDVHAFSPVFSLNSGAIRLKHMQKIKESRYFSLQFHKSDRLLGGK